MSEDKAVDWLDSGQPIFVVERHDGTFQATVKIASLGVPLEYHSIGSTSQEARDRLHSYVAEVRRRDDGRRAYHPSELPEHLKQAVSDARMDPEHDHLNSLMEDPAGGEIERLRKKAERMEAALRAAVAHLEGPSWEIDAVYDRDLFRQMKDALEEPSG